VELYRGGKAKNSAKERKVGSGRESKFRGEKISNSCKNRANKKRKNSLSGKKKGRDKEGIWEGTTIAV